MSPDLFIAYMLLSAFLYVAIVCVIVLFLSKIKLKLSFGTKLLFYLILVSLASRTLYTAWDYAFSDLQ